MSSTGTQSFPTLATPTDHAAFEAGVLQRTLVPRFLERHRSSDVVSWRMNRLVDLIGTDKFSVPPPPSGFEICSEASASSSRNFEISKPPIFSLSRYPMGTTAFALFSSSSLLGATPTRQHRTLTRQRGPDVLGRRTSAPPLESSQGERFAHTPMPCCQTWRHERV